MRSAKRRLSAVAALALMLAPVGLTAAAAASGPTQQPLQIDFVNGVKTSAVQVGFTYMGKQSDLSKLKLTENGQTVNASTAQLRSDANLESAVAFVVNLSSSVSSHESQVAVRDEIRAIIQKLPAATRVAIVGFGSNAEVFQPLTTDHEAALTALSDLSVSKGNGSTLWDAIRAGGVELNTEGNAVPSTMVLVTSGLATPSKASPADALISLRQANATMDMVAIGDPGLTKSSGLTTMVDQTGGTEIDVATAKQAAAGVHTLANRYDHQYVISYASKQSIGQQDITLQVGSAKASASYVTASFAGGGEALSAKHTDNGMVPSFLTGSLGKILGALTVALAIGLGTYSLVHIMSANSDPESLKMVLQPYADGFVHEGEASEDDGALAQTALLQRAVQMTEEFAERQGFLSKMEEKLERADVPLRAAEALFFASAAVLLVGLIGFAVMGPVGGLLILLISAFLPPSVLNFKAGMRQKKFNALLPDTLSLLSGSLRAGYSLMQGVEAVAQEVSDPMGQELRRVCTEARLGRELESSMDAVAERMNSKDFEWAVMAIRIQREVGGNLAELLMTVADTMTARERLRREVAALTAEGKISAIVLGILPVGLGLTMYVMNHEYMSVLFKHTSGLIALGVAVGMCLIGFAWMKKIININI